MFRALGKLVPVPSWDGRTDKSVLLVYKSRGIAFYAHKGGIMLYAAVFAPASRPTSPPYACGADDVIPGVAARSVYLGMSRDQLRLTPFVSSARLMGDEGNVLWYVQGRTKLLFVSLSGGRASQLQVAGEFRTPEGLTDRSTIPDIERLYGRAEEYYRVENETKPLRFVLVYPMLLVLGILTGFIIRGGMQSGDGVQTVLRPALIAAVALAVCDLASGVFATRLAGMPFDWKMAPVNVLAAGLTGAICVVIMKSLGERVSGCTGSLFTLVPVVLVSQIVTVLTIAAGPMTFEFARLLSPMPHTLFVFGMFLTGRPNTS